MAVSVASGTGSLKGSKGGRSTSTRTSTSSRGMELSKSGGRVVVRGRFGLTSITSRRSGSRPAGQSSGRVAP